MSATVSAHQSGLFQPAFKVEVPAANGYSVEVEEDGETYLHLRTGAWGGDKVAIFKRWDHVVITPNRGPDGRFIKAAR